MTVIHCAICRNLIPADQPDGLCEKCRRESAQGYAVRSLAGRCSDGAERNHGTRFHALLIEDGRVRWKALCGAEPGRWSAGWSEWGHGEAVTCPRCLKKLGQHHV